MKSHNEAATLLLAVLQAFDRYTYEHSKRVAQLAESLAQQLDLSPDECEAVYYGGLLHDMGKISISRSLLHKQGSLTPEEYDIIKHHARVGAAIVAQSKNLAACVPYIRQHHEWFDGTGYPNKLAGDKISLGARIISVVDAYDAITTTRSYDKAHSRDEAFARLEKAAGTQFDSAVVAALQKMIR